MLSTPQLHLESLDTRSRPGQLFRFVLPLSHVGSEFYLSMKDDDVKALVFTFQSRSVES